VYVITIIMSKPVRERSLFSEDTLINKVISSGVRFVGNVGDSSLDVLASTVVEL